MSNIFELNSRWKVIFVIIQQSNIMIYLYLISNTDVYNI